MNTIVILIIGMLVGVGLTSVAAWVLLRKEKETASLLIEKEKNEEMAGLKIELEKAKDALQLQKEYMQRETAERDKREQKTEEERKEQEKKQMEMLENKFKNISSELLKERQNDFKQSSTESIESTLKPLREQIQKMSDDMVKHTGGQKQLEASMKEEIDKLITQTNITATSADNLTAALKGQNKTQGDWGEMQLVQILTSMGYREGVQILPQEYIKDQFGRKIKDDEASKMRPDVILKTDETHVVVIDSKVVLKDYLNYCDAFEKKDDAAMRSAIKANTEAILNQVSLLSKQNYVRYISAPYETVEYTLMYVPVAGALRLAMGDHPGLWHEAMEKKVLIVDEFSLAAMLRVIDITWSKIEQANNTQKIIDTATTILERVELLLETVVDAEDAIKKADEKLGKSHALLTDGGQSIVTAANTLKNLGVRPKSKEYAKRLQKTAVIHEQLGESTEDSEAEQE